MTLHESIVTEKCSDSNEIWRNFEMKNGPIQIA